MISVGAKMHEIRDGLIADIDGSVTLTLLILAELSFWGRKEWM
jgi:hypothetical protein